MAGLLIVENVVIMAEIEGFSNRPSNVTATQHPWVKNEQTMYFTSFAKDR